MNVSSTGAIALLSDFGLSDCFVGLMKGVIHSIAPQAAMIDLTHHVPPHGVLVGASFLRQSVEYFPPGTVFLAVVDPGVGGERRALAAECQGRLFVAPDNGLLSFVLGQDARVHQIVNREFALDRVSNTFHGRDIFAPAAAHLCNGLALSQLGPPVDNPIAIPWPAPEPCCAGVWKLPILAADWFGNLVTSLRREDLRSLGLADIELRIGERRIGAISPTFGAVAVGEWLAYWGGADLLEVAINGASASAASGLAGGDWILLENPAREFARPMPGEAPS